MKPSEQASEDIRERMASIRSRSVQQKEHFVDESARMLDWREHVRAVPLAALAASAVAGFAIVYRLKPADTHPANSNHAAQGFQQSNFSASPPQAARSGFSNPVVAAALSMATSVLMTTGKQFLLQSLHSIMQNKNHDSQSDRDLPQRERSSSEG